MPTPILQVTQFCLVSMHVCIKIYIPLVELYCCYGCIFVPGGFMIFVYQYSPRSLSQHWQRGTRIATLTPVKWLWMMLLKLTKLEPREQEKSAATKNPKVTQLIAIEYLWKCSMCSIVNDVKFSLSNYECYSLLFRKLWNLWKLFINANTPLLSVYCFLQYWYYYIVFDIIYSIAFIHFFLCVQLC